MITNDLNHIILQKKFLSLSLSLYLSFGWSGQVRSLIGNKPTYSHRHHHHCHGHHLGCLYSNNWDFCTKGDWPNGRRRSTMSHNSHCNSKQRTLQCSIQSNLHFDSHCISLFNMLQTICFFISQCQETVALQFYSRHHIAFSRYLHHFYERQNVLHFIRHQVTQNAVD